MNKVKILIVLISLAFAACANKKDMSLYVDNNLNDSAHIGNLEIKKQKEEVLNFIVEFDNWYREKSGEIEYRYGSDFWNVGWNIHVEDEFRISFLKDSIIPQFKNCMYFTENLRGKLNTNSLKDDPGNMGMILTGSEYGCNLRRFSYFVKENEYGYFHYYGFLNTPNEASEGEPSGFRPISYEEAKFYHLSFIKLIDEAHAIYRTIINMTNGEPTGHKGFLILNMVKNNGEWMIDDMSYIEEEELIESENGYTLIDYFENKEAYETGIK